MKEKLKDKRVIAIIIVVALIVLSPVLTRIYVAVYRPWDKTIKDAYIIITEDYSRMPSVDISSSGSGLNKVVYLNSNEIQYLVLKNGYVYEYKEPNERNVFWGLEFGRVYEKIGIISDVEKLENSLITYSESIKGNGSSSYNGNKDKLSIINEYNSASYHLTINGVSYRADKGVYSILMAHM